MRRALSILLMLLFGAGPLSFVFTASAETSLPECCRRHGAHHCTVGDRQAQTSTGDVLKVPSRCSQYPHHPSATTPSCASLSPCFAGILHIDRGLKCSPSPDPAFTSVHLRTPVLRGPPGTHLS